MNKGLKVVLLVILGILIIRIPLPYLFKHHVNKALKDLDGYEGRIEDLDLNIYRGAYTFHQMTIERTAGKMRHPFIRVETIDISIDWNALLKGYMVGEVHANKPIINFAIDSTAKVTQTGIENNWVVTVKKIVPFNANLNVLKVNQGIIEYRDYSKNPEVHISLNDLSLEAKNLSNATELNEKLPSNLTLSGSTSGNGQIDLKADVYILKKMPDFDLNLELKDIELESLNNFTSAYANFDFEGGTLSFLTEILMMDGAYDGYLEPTFEHLKIRPSEKKSEDPIINEIWEGLLSLGTSALENNKEQITSKIPLKGSLEGTSANALLGGWRVFKNAFFKGIPNSVNDSIGSEIEI